MIVAAALSAATLAVGCGGQSSAAPAETRSSAVGYALLVNGQLAALSRTGRPDFVRLGEPFHPVSSGRALAIDPSTGRLYALAYRGQRYALMSCTVPQLHCAQALQLPRGLVPRAIVVAPRGGTIYIGANRKDRGGEDSLLVVARLPAQSGITVQLRRSTRFAWTIFDLAVDRRGRRLAVSYHGQNTTGADVLALRADGEPAVSPLGCAEPPPPGVACLRLAHGSVDFVDRDVVASTGTPPNVVVETNDGQLLRTWRSGLPNNHLMAIAVTANRKAVVALGSCGYSGGLVWIGLQGGAVERLAPELASPGSPPSVASVCGEIVSTATGGDMLVAQNRYPVPLAAPSRMLLLRADGSVRRAWSVPASVVGLAWAEGP